MFQIKYLRYIRQLGLVALLALAGCATVELPWRDDVASLAPPVRACAEHFAALDAAVDDAGVRDAEAHRIAGFPYLRVDRFHASLRDAAAANAPAFAQWLARLQALDHAARRVEIRNLPDAAVQALQHDGAERAALIDRTAHCADVLREHDATSPARAELIRARARVPDEYVAWYRVAGLYSVTQIPFTRGIAQWHREALREFRAARQEHEGRAAAPPLARYAPAQARGATRAQIAALLRRASDNPLRIAQFTDAEQSLLLHTYAPVFDVQTGGAYDRIGRVRWGEAAAPEVDGAAPVVYHRVAYTRYRGQVLTQLVYTVWFAERPHDHAFDLLAGKLDGVVLRVTLNADGEPLVYDSIHPCGCYHLFFPTARVEPLPAPDAAGAEEWAFAPATLPAHHAGTRLVARLATRSHYVIGVALTKSNDDNLTRYTLAPEDELRTLPVAQGTRSLYAPDGLVPGTQRAERHLFWPMGIPSAGQMRQWGRHATAFVGRRHFDDADLIEKRFRVITP